MRIFFPRQKVPEWLVVPKKINQHSVYTPLCFGDIVIATFTDECASGDGLLLRPLFWGSALRLRDCRHMRFDCKNIAFGPSIFPSLLHHITGTPT